MNVQYSSVPKILQKLNSRFNKRSTVGFFVSETIAHIMAHIGIILVRLDIIAICYFAV